MYTLRITDLFVGEFHKNMHLLENARFVFRRDKNNVGEITTAFIYIT